MSTTMNKRNEMMTDIKASNQSLNATYPIRKHTFPVPAFTAKIWCAVLVIECILIITLNILTILTFARTKYLRRRSAYSLIHVAVADLLVGSVTLPMNFYLLGGLFRFWGPITKTYATASSTVHVFTEMLSLFALVVVSLERMCAMVFPFQHRTAGSVTYLVTFLTTWLFAIFVSVAWLCSLLYLELEASLYVWVPSLIFSILIIGVSYSVLFIKVKWQSRHHKRQLDKKANKREKELAVTLVIVTASSFATVTPYVAIQIMNFMLISLSFNTLYTALVLAYANSFINPLVYMLRMKPFRKAMVSLICRTPLENTHLISSSRTDREFVTHC
ncbi:blue-sensitive opsin isoform X1 [Nematostella vectensis]|uniref:blue-sensitive opsin isoform X1 n=2 Tax=Nematostella vectensis TaxID=45351 RepID=UPI0020771221|nr:blue-sensitive opsin isoform X1 [Nematostella vectensis]